MSQRRSCDRQLTVCSLFWLGPVTNEELAEEKTLLEYQHIFTNYVVVLCEGSFDVINRQ